MRCLHGAFGRCVYRVLVLVTCGADRRVRSRAGSGGRAARLTCVAPARRYVECLYEEAAFGLIDPNCNLDCPGSDEDSSEHESSNHESESSDEEHETHPESEHESEHETEHDALEPEPESDGAAAGAVARGATVLAVAAAAFAVL